MSKVYNVREIEGLGVDAYSNLYSVAEDGVAERLPFMSFPFVVLATESGLYRVNATHVAVATILDEDDRDAIRSVLATQVKKYPNVSKMNRYVQELAANHDVTPELICQIVRVEEADNYFAEGDLEHYKDNSALWVKNQELTGYSIYPRVKLGKDVFSHSITVDGNRYSFLAHDNTQWAHRGELLTFAYRVKDSKYRNIIRETFVSKNTRGEEIQRGNRSPLRLERG